MKVQVGDKVKAHGKNGRVTATSGTDNQCIVSFEDGSNSGWMDANVVQLLPQDN